MITVVPSNFIAQVIQTGNSNAQSSVQTSIEGNGSISTHIEVNANGERKVLDSNSPGTYSLQVGTSNNSNTNNNETISPTISLSPTQAASPTPTIIERKPEIHNQSFLSNFKNIMQNFLKKIFNIVTFK